MEGITMRINFDRLSQLAGIPADSKVNLNEGKSQEELNNGMKYEDAAEFAPMEELDVEEEFSVDEAIPAMIGRAAAGAAGSYIGNKLSEVDHGSLDEMIEIDEVMLVQELRRAKQIMQENKRRKINESRRRNMFETQLKQVIDEEVQNVMEEMHLTGQWVYGDNKPTRSRKGYTHQGSMMPSFGFKRR